MTKIYSVFHILRKYKIYDNERMGCFRNIKRREYSA